MESLNNNRFFLKLAILSLLLITNVPSVLADEFQPLAVRISLTTGNLEQGFVYRVETNIPNDRRLREIPYARLDSNCEQLADSIKQLPNSSYRRQEAYKCPSSLHGSTIKIEYKMTNPGLSSLIAADLGDGFTASTALAAHQFEWTIPAQLSTLDIGKQYFDLGVLHLLTGFDHLLFILCLLFICLSDTRKLIWTITAFTLAHSLSLGLTAFGKIQINVAAVETVIALSIAYLARDIARYLLRRQKDQNKLSLSYRYPASIAGGFGLLHGLGFANILNEFGLPQTDKLLALLSFNVGIEIGQLIFVFFVMVAIGLLKRLSIDSVNTFIGKRGGVVASYFIGCTALFWTVERLVNSL